VAKLLSTDHEELYKNILKPSIKVGNDLVTQEEVSISVQTLFYCLMYKIPLSVFKFQA